MSKKILKGTIVSTKSTNTLVVNVPRLKEHPKYKKRFTSNKKYKAHYETGEYKVGDKVLIEESRPISKDKKWKVLGLVLENKNQKEKNNKDIELINKTEESLNKEI